MPVHILSNIDTLGNTGIEVSIAEKGATLLSVKVPDRLGQRQSICLAYDELTHYQDDPYYLGATIGRYPNRIAHGHFPLGNERIQLACNHGKHQLHGGEQGLHSKSWQLIQADNKQVHLRCFSVDGEGGFPGNVTIDAHFCLNNDNELSIEYHASTDKETLFAMTNHAYWNLAGAGNICNQQLQLFCDRRLMLDPEQIPTGKSVPVAKTHYDFQELRTITNDQANFEGYDDYYIKRAGADLIAYACDLHSGRTLSIRTSEPGLQFYTGHYLGSAENNNAKQFERFGGFCLETHGYPDAPNHDHFPSSIISPNNGYHQKTVYGFGLF